MYENFENNKISEMNNPRKILINKRQKGLPREALEQLSKPELIDKIVQLEAHNFQLKNILQKKLNHNNKEDEECAALLQKLNDSGGNQDVVLAEHRNNTKPSKKRKFNFETAHKRHVLLRLCYFGWDYQGFACQEDSNETIENVLFGALTRTCLIESRATSNYHRCGRTDKAVSAFGQVISIDLRSKYAPDAQLSVEALANELDYCGLLNRILPKNVQCVAWLPLCNSLYSARFDCSARTYRYYFPRGDLDVAAMRAACKQLERHADFRNFCKMDVHNGVTNYMRNLQRATVQREPNQRETDDDGYTMYYLEIKANAFLWHQIRCIMAVLLLIGQRKEEPQVISELLDVEANPCKPQYTPAIGLPLNLFHCDFRSQAAHEAQSDNGVPSPATTTESADTTRWLYNEENLQKVIENVQGEWTQFSVKCTMIRNVLHSLEETLNSEFRATDVRAQAHLLQDCIQTRQYQKLLSRKRCESLENRIEHYVKKQRLVVNDPPADATGDK